MPAMASLSEYRYSSPPSLRPLRLRTSNGSLPQFSSQPESPSHNNQFHLDQERGDQQADQPPSQPNSRSEPEHGTSSSLRRSPRKKIQKLMDSSRGGARASKRPLFNSGLY